MDYINCENNQGIAIPKCQFIPKGLSCFRIQQSSKIFVAVWDYTNIVIYGFPDKKDKSSFCEPNKVEKEEMKLMQPVVNIFVENDLVYSADVDGTMYELRHNVLKTSDMNNLTNDLDMFEMSPEFPPRWTLGKLGIISPCDTLLVISALKNKVIAVTAACDQLLVHVYRINSFCRMFAVKLLDDVDKVMISNIALPLSNELRGKYFSFLENNDTEVPLIGLNSGQALSFSLTNHSKKADVVFSSVQPVVGVSYLTDEQNQRCVAILVIISSGSLIILDGKGSKALCVADCIHYSLFNYDQSVLITSDGINSAITKINVRSFVLDSSLKCSLKGIRAVCCMPETPNLVLAATQHCVIYWLDLCDIVKPDNSGKFLMPNDQVLKKLFAKAECLNQAHIKMKKADSLLRAISLVTRSKFLENHFTILVKFFSGRNCMEDKIKLRIENGSDLAIFSEDYWSLSVTVSYGSSSVLSSMYKLDRPFTKDLPLIVECKCSPIIESELLCKMIARVEDNQPSLVVPLGKVVLDAGYFLSVVKEKSKLLKLITNPSMKSEADVVNYNNSNDLKSHVTMFNNSGSKSEKKIFLYSVKFDDSLSQNKCFPTIFRDSSHRMPKTQWLEMGDPNLSEVSALIGQKYWVEINFDKNTRMLHMKSNDIYACYFMKRAISSRLGCNTPVQLDSDIYIKTESFKYNFELARLKKDWDLKEIQTIKNEFRSHIVNKFATQKKS